AAWMKTVVEEPAKVKEGGTVVGFKKLEEKEVDVKGLDEGWEVTMARMKERFQKNEERKEALAKL
ncbi:hypothetical protein V492_08162, partial [Pseudogymnoascus sp. VKM F-4246]